MWSEDSWFCLCPWTDGGNSAQSKDTWSCGLRTPGSVCVHGLTVEIVYNLRIPACHDFLH